jgi:hypothetical protein
MEQQCAQWQLGVVLPGAPEFAKLAGVYCRPELFFCDGCGVAANQYKREHNRKFDSRANLLQQWTRQ